MITNLHLWYVLYPVVVLDWWTGLLDSGFLFVSFFLVVVVFFLFFFSTYIFEQLVLKVKYTGEPVYLVLPVHLRIMCNLHNNSLLA